jgi:hypothetical protein
MRKLLLITLLLIGACDQSTISPDEIVRRALNLVKTAPHYIGKGTSVTDFDVNAVTWTVQYQAPDRYRVKLGNTEVIVIGNSSWAYDSDKGWIPTGKPNPDPRELTKLIPPEEIGGLSTLANRTVPTTISIPLPELWSSTSILTVLRDG